LIGHYHIQLNKVDPGPAFDWDHIVGSARHLLGLDLVENAKGNARMREHLE
jgi:N-acetyl-anhydromuramyl-L-alanine amidase AmpD